MVRSYIDWCPYCAHQGCSQSKWWLDAELEWPPEQPRWCCSCGRPVSPLFQLCPSFHLIWLFITSDRLLFAMTNHIEHLDPGRVDVWINFTDVTKWQVEGIFKCFFPSWPSASSSSLPSSNKASSSSSADSLEKNLPDSRCKVSLRHCRGPFALGPCSHWSQYDDPQNPHKMSPIL